MDDKEITKEENKNLEEFVGNFLQKICGGNSNSIGKIDLSKISQKDKKRFLCLDSVDKLLDAAQENDNEDEYSYDDDYIEDDDEDEFINDDDDDNEDEFINDDDDDDFNYNQLNMDLEELEKHLLANYDEVEIANAESFLKSLFNDFSNIEETSHLNKTQQTKDNDNDIEIEILKKPIKYRLEFQTSLSIPAPWLSEKEKEKLILSADFGKLFTRIISVEKNKTYKDFLKTFHRKSAYKFCTNKKLRTEVQVPFKVEDNPEDSESCFVYVYAKLSDENVCELVNSASSEECNVEADGSLTYIEAIYAEKV